MASLTDLVQEKERSNVDDNDVRPDEDQESEDVPTNFMNVDIPSQIRAQTIRGKGNTGPKGVLADFAESQELKRISEELKHLKTEWQMRKLALASTYNPQSKSSILSH